jgi:hypothetical protein
MRFNKLRRWWHTRQASLERLIALLVLAYFLTGDAPAPLTPETQLERVVGADRFNFATWELEALAEKGAQGAVPVEAFLDDRQRAQFVVDYLDVLRRARTIENEISRVYGDPKVADPDAATAMKRAERDRLRAEIEQRRPTVEAIIQDQIAGVLADEGLALGGRVFPPVLSRVTPLPNILIISPRDEIKREPGLSLAAGLPVDRAEQIEEYVFTSMDKSALVASIGGLAVYPSMIIETTDLLWLLQVTSHEWVHHWLFFRPLGFELLLNSVSGGDTLTINETVASLIGDEVGSLVLKRYYPEIARRDYPFVYEPPKPIESPGATPVEPEPGVFNFNRAMHATRVQVDEYLAQARELKAQAADREANGQADEAEALRREAMAWIVKAETYMEERRQVFLDNGYWVRKLNQAYFAFHGSYADQPGASGADPIGPAVRDLRARIPRIADFLNAVAGVVSFDDLQRVMAQHPQ